MSWAFSLFAFAVCFTSAVLLAAAPSGAPQLPPQPKVHPALFGASLQSRLFGYTQVMKKTIILDDRLGYDAEQPRQHASGPRRNLIKGVSEPRASTAHRIRQLSAEYRGRHDSK